MQARVPRYVPQLDGLRAFAVILVLCEHFPAIQSSSLSLRFDQLATLLKVGTWGVDLFFVLSGFLITRLLLAEKAKTGGIDFRSFYIRRALRIFPIYYLVIAVCCLLAISGTGETISTLFYVSNYYLSFHYEPGPLRHTWSLAVEEQFYLVWPLLIATLSFAQGKLATRLVVPAMAVTAALLVFAFMDTWPALAFTYRGTPFRMLSLSLGAYLAFRESEGRSLKGGQGLACIAAAVLLLSATALLAILGVLPKSGLVTVISMVCYALTAFGVLAVIVADDVRPLRLATMFLKLPAISYVGRISYGIYLYHFVILYVLGIAPSQMPGDLAPLRLVMIALGLTFLLSMVSFELLEKPVLRLKGRFQGASPAIALPSQAPLDAPAIEAMRARIRPAA